MSSALTPLKIQASVISINKSAHFNQHKRVSPALSKIVKSVVRKVMNGRQDDLYLLKNDKKHEIEKALLKYANSILLRLDGKHLILRIRCHFLNIHRK